jgi:hypothetical protein
MILASLFQDPCQDHIHSQLLETEKPSASASLVCPTGKETGEDLLLSNPRDQGSEERWKRCGLSSVQIGLGLTLATLTQPGCVTLGAFLNLSEL